MRKIGVYGGTFDPIHHGHLILARDAREQLGLENVIFVPAARSPHKMNTPQSSAEARLRMVLAATEGESAFYVSNFEVRRPPPSFTVDTAEHLAARESGAEFIYLMGEDHVTELATWHRFEDLKRLVSFAVLSRSGNMGAHSFPIIERKIDISSSDIRERVASGRAIRYLVPKAVEAIIREEKLYMEITK